MFQFPKDNKLSTQGLKEFVVVDVVRNGKADCY